ncbi:hypothetical protein MMC18_004554 [Xylographa bjoerkii]|nr:hypothetical protein [Xylographa bjoerkii]
MAAAPIGSNEVQGISSAQPPSQPHNPPAENFKLRNSCDACQEAKLKCNKEKPSCRRCLCHRQPCVYSPLRRIGRPRKPAGAQSTTKTSKPHAETREEHRTAATATPAVAPDNDGRVSPNQLDPTVAPPSSPRFFDDADQRLWLPSDGASMFGATNTHFDLTATLNDDFDAFTTHDPIGQDFQDMESFFDNTQDTLHAKRMPASYNAMLDLPLPVLDKLPSYEKVGGPLDGDSILGHGRRYQEGTNTHGSNSGSTSGFTPIASSLGSADVDMDTISSDDWPSTNPRTMQPPSKSRSINMKATNNTSFRSGSGTSPPSSSRGPCNNVCYAALTQQLAHLNEQFPESSQPSIDLILQVERQTRSNKDKVLSCAACLSNRSSLLLLSMIVERVMQMLETISEFKPPATLNKQFQRTKTLPFERARNGAVSFTGNFQAPFPGIGSCPSPKTDCLLHIGGFEIDDDTKSVFVKRLLRFRLNRFAVMLTEVEQATNTNRKDCNYKAAESMVRDVYQRLELLRGMVELWE